MKRTSTRRFQRGVARTVLSPNISCAIVACCSRNCSCCFNCTSRCSSSFLDSRITRCARSTNIAVSRPRRCGRAFILLPYWFGRGRQCDRNARQKRQLKLPGKYLAIREVSRLNKKTKRQKQREGKRRGDETRNKRASKRSRPGKPARW